MIEICPGLRGPRPQGGLMKEKSDFAMELAVKGMIPDTTLGRKQLTRCRIYKNADHKHEAQKPVAYEL